MEKRTTPLRKRTSPLRLPGGSALHTGTKRVRWSVYKVTPDRKVTPLGYVIAPHEAAAKLAAGKRWPGELDTSQHHGGIAVRIYTRDSMALGKLARTR